MGDSAANMGIVHRSTTSKTKEGNDSLNAGVTQTIMTDHSGEKYRRSDKRAMVCMVLVGVLFLVMLFVSGSFLSFGDTKRISLPISATATKSDAKITFPSPQPLASSSVWSYSKSFFASRLEHPKVKQLQNCTVSFKAPPDMDFKPIWMPAYPGSGAACASKKGDMLKPIVDALTGWASGSKNYHMSIRNKLKRCHAVNSPTAVCTNGHPLTSIGPDKQTSNFHKTAILVLRNYYTAYPAFMQDKAIAYHGAKSQVSVEEWTSQQDEWGKSSFEAWKKIITTWKEMKEYDIAMYIVYEDLMDPDMGPALVERLAETLHQAGLANIAPADQIPCIWYKAVEPEYRRLLDFYEYAPAYTTELKDFLIAEMGKFVQEAEGSGDDELVRILKSYLDDIRQNIMDEQN